MNVFQKRREQYHKAMVNNSMAFIHSGDPVESTHDQQYLFEVYRNFYYLTGVDQPKNIYLAFKINNQVQEMLLMHFPSEREQRWEGTSFNVEDVKKLTGIDVIRPIEDWEDVVSRTMFANNIQDVYVDVARWRMSYAFNSEQILARKLKKAYPFIKLHNSYATVAEMRTIKSAEEIENHRISAKITEEAVKNMLDNMKPGMTESQIEAYYDFVLKSHGVKVPAFTTIAGAGKNACYMHYSHNNCVAKDNDLILFDLGAQWNHYCTDVSRTYPVNGKFTPRQKELYNVVLKGLDAALALSKPGQRKDELQEVSKQVMAEELIKLGMIEKPEEISRYYFHGSGHFIGLDTHDVGGSGKVLEKDMVFTLEPGLYFDDEAIGIRIEDTILVTEDGCEVLSAGIPKTVEEIESYMNR